MFTLSNTPYAKKNLNERGYSLSRNGEGAKKFQALAGSWKKSRNNFVRAFHQTKLP